MSTRPRGTCKVCGTFVIGKPESVNPVRIFCPNCDKVTETHVAVANRSTDHSPSPQRDTKKF